MNRLVVKNVHKYYSLKSGLGLSIKDIILRPSKLLSLMRGLQEKDLKALNDISFALPMGESLGIVGANGAGKSTLLKLLAGVLTPDQGTIAVNGKLTSLLSLGGNFQQELTGLENIYLYASMLGFHKSSVDKLLPKIREFSELGNFLNIPIKRYSSGMNLRLAFSTAVMLPMEVILVDEVLAVGDGAFHQKCRKKITELKKLGKTFIIVSHSTIDIEVLCEKTLVLDQGNLKYYGATKAALEYYQNDILGLDKDVTNNITPPVVHHDHHVVQH